jgi:hypothetical protein
LLLRQYRASRAIVNRRKCFSKYRCVPIRFLPVSFIRGACRFHGFVGAVLVVQAVFATLLAQAPRWEGTLGQTRLGPIAKALREAQAA